MADPSQWCSDPVAASPSQDRRQLVQDNGACSSLDHTRWRPLLVTGVMRHLLIHHFSDASKIEEPDLRKHVWKDNTDTGILIESAHRFRPDLVEKRPAVLVKRNGYRNLRYAIADRVATDEQGFENYGTLWVGSHSLFCIHGSGASTELLTSEVQRELTQFSPVITQELGFHKFQVTEVGSISELEEATENFVVPITVGWAYEETWRVEPEAMPLSAIRLDIGAHDC